MNEMDLGEGVSGGMLQTKARLVYMQGDKSEYICTQHQWR